MEEPMIGGDDAGIVVAPLALDSDALRAAEGVLSADECARANRFAHPRDRGRFVAARARLRELLARRLGTSPSAVALTYGAAGKPTLVRRSGFPDVRFNVSHCGDVAAIAVTEGRDVGVDIEAVRPLAEVDDLATLVFSERERAEYRALPSEARVPGFFNGWTRKEAFVKAVGDGLGYRLDEFDVSLTPGAPARLLRVGRATGDRCGWSMRAFDPAAGMVGALVVAVDTQHQAEGR